MKNENIDLEPTLTIKDLAARLQVSEASIRRWKREGHMPQPMRVGRQLRWRLDAINEWLDGLSQAWE